MSEDSSQFEYKVDIFKSELQKILGTSGVAQKFTIDIIKIMTQIWGKDIIMEKNIDLLPILNCHYQENKINDKNDNDNISSESKFIEVCKGLTKDGNPCRSNQELVNGFCRWHRPSCKGMTLKNTKCKIVIDLDVNGYCNHHKGQFNK